MLEFLIRRRIIIAIAVFFIVRTAGIFVIPPTVCRDGWPSPSIGHRGACSWHGGVGTNWVAVLVTIASFGAGFATWTSLSRVVWDREELQREVWRQEKAVADEDLKRKAATDGVACPKCGFPLRLRIARRGRYAGKHFLGCSRYPTCTGLRNLTPLEHAAIAQRSVDVASSPSIGD